VPLCLCASVPLCLCASERVSSWVDIGRHLTRCACARSTPVADASTEPQIGPGGALAARAPGRLPHPSPRHEDRRYLPSHLAGPAGHVVPAEPERYRALDQRPVVALHVSHLPQSVHATIELDDGRVLLVENVAHVSAAAASVLARTGGKPVGSFDVVQVAQLEDRLGTGAHLPQQREDRRPVAKPRTVPGTLQKLLRADPSSLHRPGQDILDVFFVDSRAQIDRRVGDRRAGRVPRTALPPNAGTFPRERPTPSCGDLSIHRHEYLALVRRPIHQAPDVTCRTEPEPGAGSPEQDSCPCPCRPRRVPDPQKEDTRRQSLPVTIAGEPAN